MKPRIEEGRASTRRKEPKEPGRKNTRQRTLMGKLLCIVCGQPASEGHHLKRGIPKNERGLQRKAHDRYMIPVCRREHEVLEKTDDEAWLMARKIDARSIAEALYRYRNDERNMRRVVENSLMERRVPFDV